jgi:hypothetical protein
MLDQETKNLLAGRLSAMKTDESIFEIKERFHILKREHEAIEKWEAKLPKYKRITYTQSYIFTPAGGIGVAVSVRREYSNGKVFTLDATDYATW